MKASELRIGNIVSIYSNGTVKIPCYPIKKKILRVGIFKCNCININENLAQVEKWDEIESNMLAPIPHQHLPLHRLLYLSQKPLTRRYSHNSTLSFYLIYLSNSYSCRLKTNKSYLTYTHNHLNKN